MKQLTVLEMIKKCENKPEEKVGGGGKEGQNPQGSRAFWEGLEKEKIGIKEKERLAQKDEAGRLLVNARKSHWEGLQHRKGSLKNIGVAATEKGTKTDQIWEKRYPLRTQVLELGRKGA